MWRAKAKKNVCLEYIFDLDVDIIPILGENYMCFWEGLAPDSLTVPLVISLFFMV